MKERKKRALLFCLIHFTTETYECPRKQKKIKLNKKRARNKEQDRKIEKEFLRMRRKIQKIRSRDKLSLK